MTAPTPEKLAAGVARQLQETLAELTTTRATLAAVTAERDQALEALAATNKLGAFETGKTIGAAEVRKELDQARQMLADAPHEFLECTRIGLDCRCWKAKL